MYKFTAEERAESRKLINELYEQHYGSGANVAKQDLSIKPSRSGGRKANPVTPTVVDTTIQVVTKPENIITVPKPVIPKQNDGSPKISKLVQTLLGTTVNSIQVVSYNAELSVPGKPQVNCICTKCNDTFTVNAYHVQYQRKVDCGKHA